MNNFRNRPIRHYKEPFQKQHWLLYFTFFFSCVFYCLVLSAKTGLKTDGLTMFPLGFDTWVRDSVHLLPLHCSMTLTGPGCKGIRDWCALPLSGHWAIHSQGSVQTAERMQSDLHLMDIRILLLHINSILMYTGVPHRL